MEESNQLFNKLSFLLFFIFNKLGDFDDGIYPIELEIEDTTDTARFASCIDLHSEIDSEDRFVL